MLYPDCVGTLPNQLGHAGGQVACHARTGWSGSGSWRIAGGSDQFLPADGAGHAALWRRIASLDSVRGPLRAIEHHRRRCASISGALPAWGVACWLDLRQRSRDRARIGHVLASLRRFAIDCRPVKSDSGGNRRNRLGKHKRCGRCDSHACPG